VGSDWPFRHFTSLKPRKMKDCSKKGKMKKEIEFHKNRDNDVVYCYSVAKDQARCTANH
jgi:hypothetical protein